MSESRRETLLSIAFAVWGLAVAIALAAVWMRPAPPGQLASFATRFGFDAHGPFRWIAGMIVLPIVFPLLLRPLARRIRDGFAWWAVFVAPFVTLWYVSIQRNVWWALVPCAVVTCTAALRAAPGDGGPVRDRRYTLLLPTFLAAFLAVLDIAPNLGVEKSVIVAALIVFALRMLAPPHAFAVAPLAMLLQTGFFARDQRYNGWVPLAILVLSVVVLRFLKPLDRRVIVFVVYPLALWAYADATNLKTAEGKVRMSMFEDSHSLLPASEYLRGELPFRDIMPLHGLIEDGLIDYVALKTGDVNAGTRSQVRYVVGSLNVFALYAAAFAITGSAEGALLAVLLSMMTGSFSMTLRVLPSLIVLALVAAAIRWRRPRLFAYAGFMTVVSGLTSIDYAFYTFVAFVVAVVRQRGSAWRPAAIGVAAGVVPLAIVLAAMGIFDDFVRMTFSETLHLGPVYVLNFFTPPGAIAKTSAFPDVLVSFLDRETFMFAGWCAVAIFTAVTVTCRARRGIEPLVIAGVWIVLSAISYAERHHLLFTMLLAVFAVYVILRLRGDVAAVAIVAAIVLAAPTTHVAIVNWLRHARGPVEAHWVEVRELPRARGVLWRDDDAAAIRSAAKYASLSLAPDETFFDFSNRGILYFLLRRDCPIREYEVADYQSEERQREVIRRIEGNPKVRAVLVPGPLNRYIVDGVLNQERAPLVWQYLQKNFHPDFAEGDTVFWRRR